MGFLGRGRNCQQSFSGFKFFRIHLEAEKFQEGKKEKRITRAFTGFGGVRAIIGLPAYTYLGPWGVHGLSARATDHCPVIFVHSRLVKGPVA